MEEGHMAKRYLYLTGSGRHNIVHFSGCHYLNRKPNSARLLEYVPSDLYTSSFSFCQHCSPVAVIYRKERARITKYAEEHNQKLTMEYGMLHIANGYSEWMVVPSDRRGCLCLYHKSTVIHVDDESPIAGYHLQMDYRYSIAKIQKYIVSHDLYRKSANAKKQAERKRLQALTAEAAAACYKKSGKKKRCASHFTPKKKQVIVADTSDWEAFTALFKPNAAR